MRACRLAGNDKASDGCIVGASADKPERLLRTDCGGKSGEIRGDDGETYRHTAGRLGRPWMGLETKQANASRLIVKIKNVMNFRMPAICLILLSWHSHFILQVKKNYISCGLRRYSNSTFEPKAAIKMPPSMNKINTSNALA